MATLDDDKSDDLGCCDDWLCNLLTGDPALSAIVAGRVYPDLAPAGAVMPYVVYSCADGSDDDTLGDVTAVTDLTYDIRVVWTGGSYAILRPAVLRLQALLHGTEAVLPSVDAPAFYLTVRRGRPHRYFEYEGDVHYIHSGAEYRFRLQPTF